MKKLAAGIAVVALVLTAGVSYARWGGYGPGWCASSGANVENLKKFQKESLTLRDELMTKELDLENEYAKASPDTKRIAALKKDIIDIEVKIQTIAEKNGLPAAGCANGPRGRGMRGYGVTAGGPGSCGGCRNW